MKRLKSTIYIDDLQPWVAYLALVIYLLLLGHLTYNLYQLFSKTKKLSKNKKLTIFYIFAAITILGNEFGIIMRYS